MVKLREIMYIIKPLHLYPEEMPKSWSAARRADHMRDHYELYFTALRMCMLLKIVPEDDPIERIEDDLMDILRRNTEIDALGADHESIKLDPVLVKKTS